MTPSISVLFVLALAVCALAVVKIRRFVTKLMAGKRVEWKLERHPEKRLHCDEYRFDKGIPRIIHQTWKTGKLPRKFVKNQEAILALHPRWEYRLWTDKDIDVFVDTHFPSLSSKFQALPLKIMKIDMFRYMLMYVHGGVYVDLDYKFFKPLDAWVADCDLLIPAENDNVNAPNFLGQGLLASCPEHLFWQDVIKEVFDRTAEELWRLVDPVDDTGPHLITRVFKRNPERYGIKISKRVFFCPPPRGRPIPEESYGIHECAGTWR